MRFDAHWLAARGEGPSSTCLPRHAAPPLELMWDGECVCVYPALFLQKRLIAFFNAFMPFLPQIPDPFVTLLPFYN